MKRQFPAALGVLLASALLPAGRLAAQQDAAGIFKQSCQACHGARGKGDGPAAAGLRPRPPDLSDSVRMSRMTDAKLTEVIIKGAKGMPAYGSILKPFEVHELVVYLRSFSRKSRPA